MAPVPMVPSTASPCFYSFPCFPVSRASQKSGKVLLTLSQLLQTAAQLHGLRRFGLLGLRQALLRVAQGVEALLLLEIGDHSEIYGPLGSVITLGMRAMRHDAS